MAIYELDGVTPFLPDDGDFYIAPDATVIGKVRLAKGASIWFGVVIRGDNELIDIGLGSNVQDLSAMHTDPGFPITIGAGCTIGHRVMLHGCTIGDNALIGMGATILNGAHIGANCLIGAGALIPEGREIPDGCLVMGMPGKVVRQLDDAAIGWQRSSARHYVENGRRFSAGLRKIG